MLPYFWLPEEGLLDRDRKEGGHYRTWRDAGLLETTPGKAINFKAIIKRLAEINARVRSRARAYDRAFYQHFHGEMRRGRREAAARGIRPRLCQHERRRCSCSRPRCWIKRIHHGGHPILRWQVSNVAIEMDASANRKPSKKRATGHIDGVVASDDGDGCRSAADRRNLMRAALIG